MLSVTHTCGSKGQAQSLLGAGHRNIEKPAFFLQFLRSNHHASGRKQILLHTCHEHIRKLQSLGRMDRHQCDSVGRGFVRDIIGADKCRTFQIIRHADHRKTFSGYRRGIINLPVSDHVFNIAVVSLLDMSLDAVKQFVNIGKPRLAFD